MRKFGSAAFGAWLRGRIGPRSYGHLATYLGVSTSTVSRWVTGDSAPEHRNRMRLAAYLDASIEEIDAFFPEGSRDGAGRGIQNPEEAPAPPVALARPAILFYGPDGAIDGVEGLTAEEAASVRAAIAAFQARRASGGTDAAGGSPGTGGAR